MVCNFVINIVYLNLNSIFNILNTITTKYRFWPIKKLNFGNWASWFSFDFPKILTIWASFSRKLFSYKIKSVYGKSYLVQNSLQINWSIKWQLEIEHRNAKTRTLEHSQSTMQLNTKIDNTTCHAQTKPVARPAISAKGLGTLALFLLLIS